MSPTAAETIDRRGEPPMSAAERRSRRADELIASVDGRRDLVEQMRADLQDRLHRRSDDFEATAQLRVVETALTRLTPRVDRRLAVA
jgi:hypothetical protein